VFDSGGNLLNGTSQGWWATEVKKEFNLTLNVISPNVAGGGDTLYQTRTAAGFLADLYTISDAQMLDCIKAGLALDLTSYMSGLDNLAKYSLATKNTQAVLGTGDKVMAIAEGASLMPGTTPQMDGGNPNFGPYMRWDYYKELGYPDMKNYTDMLNVLKQMQTNHPKSISGKKTYGISLFKDWDGGYSAFVSKFVDMYGFTEMNNDYIFINEDATKTSLLTDTNGPYYQALKMIFQANTMGLLDPDSPSNTWTSLAAKVQDGAVLFQPWPWNSVDGVNNATLGAKGQGWALCPVDDMTFLANGVNPYGSGSIYGLDAHTKNPAQIMAFLDWYGSPAGMWFSQNGPEGLTWDMSGGKPTKTDFGLALAGKQAGQAPVPAQYGGGDWFSGGNPLNDFVGTVTDIDPDYNEPYQNSGWSSVIAANQNALTQDWQNHFGATSVLDWLNSNNRQVVQPGNTYVRPNESSTLTTEKNQIATAVKTASWQCMFAKNQSQFDSIWNAMVAKLPGLGMADVLKTEQTYVDGYKAAIAQALADAAAASNS
jgi:multiple sugar transport system substrate-binding protein/putative aldouronate transport system substrate-binding protein